MNFQPGKVAGQNYVFYQRLLDEGKHPGLAGAALSNALRYKTIAKDIKVDILYDMAKAEFAKEQKLLKEKFGVDIEFYGYSNNFNTDFKNIIELINSCLNLKQVYERNKQLIKVTKGKKAVFSFYPTYFMKVWQKYWPKIKDRAEYRFGKNQDLASALSEVLDELLPTICIESISLMLNGPEVEDIKKMDPKLKNAYSSLINYIGDIQQQGSFAQQIYKAYGLDELKQQLIQSVQINETKLKASNFKPKVKSMIEKQLHQRGGLTLEAVETAIFQSIAGDSGNVIHSGDVLVKADNILTFSVDTSIIQETLDQAGNNREENIKAFNKLSDKLQNLDDGFIVYSSDKNYTLNMNFKGFSTGAVGKNAASFLNRTLQKNVGHTRAIIDAVQQLGKGAIMDKSKGIFEEYIAQEIAYMLFDDYNVIGIETSGVQSIHIMNLNGIMMPLSGILVLLARSIEKAIKYKPTSIVKVNIDAPDILYWSNQEQQKEWPNDSIGAWNYQRDYTLQNTKITATFLKDFSSIVREFL